MRNFEVNEGVYIPESGINYPDDPYKRLVHVEVEDSSKGKYKFDSTYKYLDDSFSYKLNSFFNAFLLWGYAHLYNRIVMGLRIDGKENLRKYRSELSNGAMTICNHCFVYDAVAVYRAVRFFKRLWIPMYAKHFNGSQSWFIRYMGGIPVPETQSGAREFSKAFDTLHERKQWIHIFPEEVRWDFYKPLRPFRKGAFIMAYKYGIPIVPCVINYRPRTGIFKLFGPKSKPLLTLVVGEPVIPDKTAPRQQEVSRLRQVCHDNMLRMAGIKVNPFPADDALYEAQKKSEQETNN